MSNLLAIDPGTTLSAYVLMDSDYRPYEFAKINNADLLLRIRALDSEVVPVCAIEMIASYGMSVGAEVFETCVWIGRFWQELERMGVRVERVYRKEVKLNLCQSPRANDSCIRQALIDRFGVVGKKAAPGFFWGFKADIWAAYGVAVTFLDKQKEAKVC